MLNIFNIGEIFTDKKREIKTFFGNKKQIYLLLIITAIYMITYYTIFRANFNYIDDLSRTMFGYRGWKNFSRYFSEFFSIILNTNKYLTDISPLTQIIACIILAICGIVLLNLFDKNKKLNFFSIIAVLFIGLNPFFLECISYKYDSPYMAFSILVSIIPFIFYKKGLNIKNQIPFIITSIVGTLLMCMSYQASSGIFPLIALFLSFKYWNDSNDKEWLKIILISSVSYIIGILVFKCFIMTPVSTYVSTEIYPFNQMISGIMFNLTQYYSLIFNNFNLIWLIFILILFVFFPISVVTSTKRNKSVAFIISIVLIIISSIICFGLYIVMQKITFVPRIMYGFCFLITLIVLYSLNCKFNGISKVFSTCLIYCFIVLAFTYGNALNYQKEYTLFRINNIVDGLNEIDYMKDSSVKNFKIVSNPIYSPVVENENKLYSRMIKILVPTFLGSTGWVWDYYYLLNYYNIKNLKVNDSIDDTNLPILKDTFYYTIKGNENNIVVYLRP